MKGTFRAVVLLAALLAGGCRLYFWAGDHELRLPPEREPEPTPTATPPPKWT